MKRLALLGASGHGKVVADMALCIGWEEVVFFDDAWPSLKKNGAWSVVGDTNALSNNLNQFEGVLVSIGDCATRWKKHQSLKQAGARLVSLVHPKAWVSSLARVEPGSVLMAGAMVNVDTVLGEACIVNTGATIDHDCRIASGVHISPGAHLAGNVTVESCSWVGLGALVKQGIRIGSHVTVGAGAVVVKPVSDDQTVVGIPARTMNLINA